jgi:hypothetical protein
MNKGEQLLLDYLDGKVPLESIRVKRRNTNSVSRLRNSVDKATISLVEKGILTRNKDGYLERKEK